MSQLLSSFCRGTTTSHNPEARLRGTTIRNVSDRFDCSGLKWKEELNFLTGADRHSIKLDYITVRLMKCSTTESQITKSSENQSVHVIKVKLGVRNVTLITAFPLNNLSTFISHISLIFGGQTVEKSLHRDGAEASWLHGFDLCFI